MRINEIENKNVNVLLTADELVKLMNVMHFYEEAHKVKLVSDKTFHNLYAQIILAANVCQYGHMDDFATSRYVRHKLITNPNGRLAKIMNGGKTADITDLPIGMENQDEE